MRSESIKEISIALAKAQVAFKPIKRTEKVGYDTKSGSKKYNYAPLEVVIEATREALSVNGLAVTQSTKLVENNMILETLLAHSSGEWFSGELFIGKQDLAPQSLGSSLTYMRRYSYSAMLCVSSEEDDDGESASSTKSSGKSDIVSEPALSRQRLNELVPLGRQRLHELAQEMNTGGDLGTFALKHGWTKEQLQETLGIKSLKEIKDVKAAAIVLFPKAGESTKNTLVEEALRLGAEEGKGTTK